MKLSHHVMLVPDPCQPVTDAIWPRLLMVFKLSGPTLDLGQASATTWLPYPLFGLFIEA